MQQNQDLSTSTRTSIPLTAAGRDHRIGPRPALGSALAGAGLALLLGGCAGEGTLPIGVGEQALDSNNGLSLNGLSLNGLSLNGLSLNGLSLNGLSTTSFTGWFNKNPTYSPLIMTYVVKCALPAGSQIAWQDPSTGTSYTWPGELGLAPGWSAGHPATLAEQQVISACLAAHANKYGVHIHIAVEGTDAEGVRIPMAPDELTTYPVREGCFFGNLFADDGGVYVGLDHPGWNATQSSARACAYDTSRRGDNSECLPILTVGACTAYCTKDPTGVYYTQCTYGGKTYLPLTTRLLTDDIYECGDGICQFTESCGSGKTYDNCRSDCGRCPEGKAPQAKAGAVTGSGSK